VRPVPRAGTADATDRLGRISPSARSGEVSGTMSLCGEAGAGNRTPHDQRGSEVELAVRRRAHAARAAGLLSSRPGCPLVTSTCRFIGHASRTARGWGRHCTVSLENVSGVRRAAAPARPARPRQQEVDRQRPHGPSPRSPRPRPGRSGPQLRWAVHRRANGRQLGNGRD